MNDKTIQVDGVTLMLGTPSEHLGESALVVKLWRTLKECDGAPGSMSKRSHSMASIYVVRPDRAGYIIKPLVAAAEIRPETALSCVVSAAHLTGVAKVYLNADLERLPTSPCTIDADLAGDRVPTTEEDHVRFSLALP